MMKKLTKGIEESKKEKERLTEEKEKLKANFKEIEQKAFVVQENYKKTQEVHLIVLLLFGFCRICAYAMQCIKNELYNIAFHSCLYMVVVVWSRTIYFTV